MSKIILVMGESGSGKTTAMRNLNPESTYYFDCDKKGLSWRGWKDQYNKEKKNYMRISEADKIAAGLVQVSKDYGHIKTVVIDTLNGIMIDDEFKRMKEKGFDKWQDMAYSVRALIATAMQCRDDLVIIFIGHTQTERDESGFTFTRMKTSGKKLDKVVLESMFTTVLLAKCVDGKYLFETQSRNSTAKSPMGAIPEFEVENEIKKIINLLEEF